MGPDGARPWSLAKLTDEDARPGPALAGRSELDWQ